MQEGAQTAEETRPVRRAKRGVLPASIAAALLLAAAALARFLPNGLLSSPLARRDTVLTVGDFAISSDEYVYRFLDEKEQYESQDAAYFESGDNEKTFFEKAEQYLRSQYAILQWAKELGFEKNEQTAAAAQMYIDSVRSNYDSDAAFDAALAEKHLTPALYRSMLENEQLLNSFAEYIYADADFAAVSDAQALAYAQEKGAFAFKCILITAGDGDAAAEKETLARDIAAKLQAEPARFDEYAALYNEDPLAARYPDGFNMLPGELSAELETIVTSLADGAVSDAVLTESGWFILTRSPLTPQAFTDDVITRRIEEKIDGYIAAMPVKYGRGYHNMKADEIIFIGDLAAK
ncbi:MAG: SurA N-terminal domain-containing protein [Oscillospiraceae bacterium]|nr:SurA N-terminal domain-containing protein [Oscillospiraceae bacterium]